MKKLPSCLQEFCFSWSNMHDLAEVMHDNLDYEAEVIWICNVIFINSDNNIDETQFDIPVFASRKFREAGTIMHELWELWTQFAIENHINSYKNFQTFYIYGVER